MRGAIVARFKVLFRDLPVRTKENHDTLNYDGLSLDKFRNTLSVGRAW